MTQKREQTVHRKVSHRIRHAENSQATKLKLTAPKPPLNAPLPKLDSAPNEDSTSSDLTSSLLSSAKARSTSKSSETSKPERPEKTVPPKKEEGDKVGAKITAAAETPKGLLNDGRNCFLSAAIQCLADDLANEYRPLKGKVVDGTSALDAKNAAVVAASKGKNTRRTAATKAKVQAAFEKIPKDRV